MRRLTFLIIFLLLPLMLFGAENAETSMIVKGYYMNSQQGLLMTVTDVDGERLYETDAEVTSSNIGKESPIFNWSITGNSNNYVSVKFTFTTFQTYLNGLYYRPAYTFKMYQNKSITQNGRSDSFYAGASAKIVIDHKSKVSADYTFTGTSSVLYRGVVNDNKGYTWTRSGYCTMNITDYEKASGSYEYKCRVTVEYKTE